MATSFLDDMVVAAHGANLSAEYGRLSPADRERLACCSRPVRDFAGALTDRLDVAVIAEVKKASPSAGPIAPQCEAGKQALQYQYGGAAAISVLTEPESLRRQLRRPLRRRRRGGRAGACKDFVVDPVQLFVARGHGADAMLLMVSVLGDGYAEYIDIAETLGMTALRRGGEPGGA